MRAALALALTLAACGGSSASPDGAGDDGDRVDSPIGVDGAARRLALTGACTVRNPNNVTTGSTLRVDCRVMLTRDGTPVELAQVRINPAPPGLQTQLLATGTPGEYDGYYLAYGLSARVSASQGDDEIPETPFPGPQVFQVTAPEGGAFVADDAPVRVTWTEEGDAQRVAIATASGHAADGLTDDGVEDLPVGAIVGADVLTVTKWMSTPLGDSAAPGSTMDFGLEVTRDVYLEGTPLPDAAP